MISMRRQHITKQRDLPCRQHGRRQRPIRDDPYPVSLSLAAGAGAAAAADVEQRWSSSSCISSSSTSRFGHTSDDLLINLPSHTHDGVEVVLRFTERTLRGLHHHSLQQEETAPSTMGEQELTGGGHEMMRTCTAICCSTRTPSCNRRCDCTSCTCN